MSALHGRCSLSAPVCAALGTTLTSAHVTPATHLPGTGVTVLFTGLLALSGFLHRLTLAGAATGRPQWRPVLLLVPGFFSAFVEGAVSDWNAVYLNGWKHAGHGSPTAHREAETAKAHRG